MATYDETLEMGRLYYQGKKLNKSVGVWMRWHLLRLGHGCLGSDCIADSDDELDLQCTSGVGFDLTAWLRCLDLIAGRLQWL